MPTPARWPRLDQAGERFLKIPPVCVSSLQGVQLGVTMKKLVLIAALALTSAAQPGWAAGKECVSPSAMEAEQGIRYVTDLMVVSSVCQDTVYAEFRLRNRDVILGYQKALIAR